MSAGDNVDLRLDTSQLTAALDAAILKFREFYTTIGAGDQAFAKVINAGTKVVKTIEDQAKLAKTGAYAFNEVSKAVDGLTVSLSKEALQNKDVVASLDAVRSKLATVAKSAGDTKTALRQATRVSDPTVLAAATKVAAPVAIDQSVVAKYQRNLFRLAGDDISALGTKAQYTFRQIAKDAGEFAAKAGIPWDTFVKKLKAVQEGDIKIFKPGVQADTQNVLIGLANQYEVIARAKERAVAVDRREGLAQVAALEEVATRRLAKANAERIMQMDQIAKRQREIAQQARDASNKEKDEIAAREINAKRDASILASQQRAQTARATAERQYQQEQRQRLAAQKSNDELEARAINKTFNAQRDASAFQKQLQSGLLRQKELTTQYDAATQQLTKTYVTLNKAGQQQVTTMTQQNGALKSFTQTTYDATKGSQGLLISWQSIIRMFSAQLLQQAMASFLGNMTQAVNAARDLQIQVGLVQTISSAGFDNTQWMNGIKGISDATGLLAQDVSKGLYDTLSNQIADGGKSLEFLTNVSQFAIATNSTLKDSVDAVSSAINSYGLTSESATRITDVFFKLIDLGRITADQFANDIGRILPGANQLGVSIEEVSAALSVLTRSGVTPATAMTSLFNIFSRLLKPAGEMKEFLRSIGVASGQAAIQTYGFAQVLGKVAEFSQGKPELLAQLFPDVRGLRGILNLAGEGLKEFFRDLDQMRNAAGSVAKAVNLVADTFGKRFQIELNKVQNYFTNVWGQSIVETVVKVSDSIGGLTNVLKSVVDGMIVAVEALAVTAIPLLTRAFAGLGVAIAANPVGAIAVGVTAVVAGIQIALNKEVEAIERENDRLDEALKRARDLNVELAAKATEGIQKASEKQASGLGLLLADATIKYDKFAEDITATHDKIMDSFKESSTAFFNYLGNVSKGYKDTISDAEALIKKINKFSETEPANVEARKRKIALGEAETNQEKFNLLEQELIITRINQAMAQTRDEQIAYLNQANDITEQMYKVQRDQEKEVGKDSKERIKLTKERAKLEREIAADQKRLSIQEMDQQEKIKKEAKKGTVVTRDGQLVPIGNRQELLAAKDDLKTEQLSDRILERQKRLAVINLELKKSGEAAIKGQIDLSEEFDHNYELQQQLDDASKKRALQEAEAARIKQEQLAIDIKLSQAYLAEINAIKFDKLVDPDLSKEKFDKIVTDGDSALAKYSELVRQYAGEDFKERQKLETDLSNIRQSIAATEEQARKRITSRELQDKLVAIKAQQEAERETTQKDIEKARAPLAALRTVVDINTTQQLSAAIARVREVAQSPDLFGNVRSNAQFAEKRLVFIEAALKNISEGTNLKEAFQSLKNSADKLAFIPSSQRGLSPEISALLEGIKKVIPLETALTGTYESIAKAEQRAKDIEKKFNDQTAELSKQLGADIALAHDNNLKLQEAAKDMKTSAQLLAEISGQLKTYIDGSKNGPPAIINAPITKAMGGLIHGSDNIPALLGKGEFVVNAAATRRFYSQLVAMNGVQSFNRGGLVNNVGDINVSMHSSGNVQSDIVAIGKGIQREIRRGRLKFS